jgi:3-methyladenine DNA glycosylase Mpg
MEGIEDHAQRARKRQRIYINCGPGNLTKAMAFTHHTGTGLLGDENLSPTMGLRYQRYTCYRRIGVDYAREVRNSLRFILKNNPYVSMMKRQTEIFLQYI